jgi:hypothetical protein
MTTTTFHLQGNYAPVTDELTAFDLPITGAIPRPSSPAGTCATAQPARGFGTLVHG